MPVTTDLQWRLGHLSFVFFAREGEGGSGGSSRTFELVNSACMINLFGFLPGIFC